MNYPTVVVLQRLHIASMQIKIFFSLAFPAICIAATIPIHGLVEPRSPVVGGSPIHPGAVPFMVSIQTTQGVHHCGGSLISATAVLTALHCVQGFQASQLSVRAGTIVNYSAKQSNTSSRLMQHVECKQIWPSSQGVADCTAPSTITGLYT